MSVDEQFEKLMAKRREYFQDFSLRHLLEKTEYKLLEIKGVQLEKKLDEEQLSFPIQKVKIVCLNTGALSQLSLYPRYAAENIDDFLGEAGDVFIRFSITRSGNHFYIPTYTYIRRYGEDIKLTGERIDWGWKYGQWDNNLPRNFWEGKLKTEALSDMELYMLNVKGMLDYWIFKGTIEVGE